MRKKTEHTFPDYDFCLYSKLSINDLLIWLDLDSRLDKLCPLYSYDFFGRNMMIIDESSSIRISCIHKDFDRWANSEELCFDISKKSEKRAFIDWVIAQREQENSI